MIRTLGVMHEYEKSEPVLSDIELSVRAGEMLALTGASGRGKSTLLFIIGLLLRPTRGSVMVGGVDTAGLTDRQRSLLRADMFGYLFQEAALDPGRTVLANVTEPSLYSRSRSRSRSREVALGLLGALEVELRADAFPSQVSGGQAQRIGLARALVLHPPIIIADEPTSSLDEESAAVVIGAMRAHARAGNAIIVASHDRRVVAASDREFRL